MTSRERNTFGILIGSIVVLFTVNVVSLFDGVTKTTKEVEEKEVIGTHKNDIYGFKFWTDPETGCQYIVKETYNSAAITPRMETSGKIKGC